MEYVYGAMLLHSAGQKVDEAGLKKVMTASGVKADEAKIKALVASLEGVNIDEAITKCCGELLRGLDGGWRRGGEVHLDPTRLTPCGENATQRMESRHRVGPEIALFPQNMSAREGRVPAQKHLGRRGEPPEAIAFRLRP